MPSLPSRTVSVSPAIIEPSFCSVTGAGIDSRGTCLVRTPILVTTILVRSVRSALREGRTMSLRSTPASTFWRRSPTVCAGMLRRSTLALPTLRLTSLGVVISSAMPERSMSAPRLTESAELPMRSPSWSSALATVVAVVQRVRFLSPSMLSSSGRPRRTAIREPSLTGESTLGHDRVVLAGLDALRRQHVADVVAEGADLGLVAVDRQRDRAAERHVGGRGAAEGDHDRADEAAEKELVVDETRKDGVRV